MPIIHDEGVDETIQISGTTTFNVPRIAEPGVYTLLVAFTSAFDSELVYFEAFCQRFWPGSGLYNAESEIIHFPFIDGVGLPRQSQGFQFGPIVVTEEEAASLFPPAPGLYVAVDPTDTALTFNWRLIKVDAST